MRDGPSVALAFLASRAEAIFGRRRRDPGERAAERYLRATGHRILARNWRSPRDRRDEADLVALTPDRCILVIAEVKRARGPWDALDRVDRGKREALWRLLEDVAPQGGGSGPFLASHPGVTSVRVDLIGVRGERDASVMRHLTGLFERGVRGGGRGYGRGGGYGGGRGHPGGVVCSNRPSSGA